MRRCLADRSETAHDEELCSLVKSLDWETVRQEAVRHRVLPLLHRRLDTLLGEDLPVPVREDGREHRRGVRIRNTFLIQELGRVVEAFEAAGLPVLAMKGPVLSKVAFGDIASRHSVDLDLMIPRGRFSEARGLLLDMGYNGTAKRAALEGWRKTLSLYLDGQWEFARGSSFTLDVHTRAMPSGYSFPAAPEPIWERAQPVTLHGDVTVPSFSPEDRILVLAHHGVKNQWRALRHVADIAGALRAPSGLDWQLLQESARTLHAARTTQLGLFLAHDLLDAPLPPSVLDWIGDAPVRRVGKLMTAYLRNRYRRSALRYRERLQLQLTTKDTVGDQVRYGAHSLLGHLWSSAIRP